MIGLLQRVTEAHVEAGDATIAEIGIGLLVLVAIERGDTEVQAERLLERLLGYRVFPDVEGKMNRSLQDIGGGLLLVPQFTLAADTRKGMRPSLTPAADPSARPTPLRLSRRARPGAPSDRRSRPFRGPYASQAHQ